MLLVPKSTSCLELNQSGLTTCMPVDLLLMSVHLDRLLMPVDLLPMSVDLDLHVLLFMPVNLIVTHTSRSRSISHAGRSVVTHTHTCRSTTHAGRSITHAGRSRSTIVHTGKSNITPTYVLLWIRGQTRPCSWTWRSMPSIGVSTSAAAGRPRPWQSEKWLPPSRRSAGRACRSRLTAAMLIPPLRTER